MANRSPQHHPLQESFSFMAAPLAGKDPLPPFDAKGLARLAAQGIFVGTSSWKYRGWEGLIYRGGYSSEAQFQRASLREYSYFLPTVGIEFTYFTWPLADMMAYLAESTPDNFQLCLKVTKRITLKSFPPLPVYGKWAGKENPDYLSLEQYRESFLKPLDLLGPRLGLVVFEFVDFRQSDEAEILRFLASAGPTPRAALQLWGEAPSSEFYAKTMELGAIPGVHIYFGSEPADSQWKRIQWARQGRHHGLPFVFFASQHPNLSPEEAHKIFSPFHQLHSPDPHGLAVAADLSKRAMGTGGKAYILLSNRWEGSAPHSIGRLWSLLS